MSAVLDAVAGASLLTVAIAARRRFPRSALLALLAALAWFVVPLAPGLVLLHRPLLLHAAFALASGRGARFLPRATLAVAWVGVALPPGGQPVVALVTAAGCVGVGASRGRLQEPGRLSAARASRRATFMLAAGMALPVLERAAWPRYGEAGLPVATYLSAVTIGSAVMLRGILASGQAEADAVIELSEGTPAEALAELRRLALSEPDSPRGRVLGSAIALLEENTRLQDELEARIADVRASRARLLDASMVERRRLEGALQQGAMRYLRELEHLVTDLADGQEPESMATACLEEIGRTREDLEQLARGLHPRIVSDHGLRPALEDLGRRGPLPVQVDAPEGRFPERVETAVWYVCAEALANAWKHARATRAAIHVRQQSGSLVATIGDDGVGGARLSPGGGLSGLADRLADVGGSLSLASSAAGTVVTVRVPVR